MNHSTAFSLKVEPIGENQIRLTRSFAAPRDLVFRALTDSSLTPRWWGMRSSVTTVDRMDVWPGGSWRFVQTDPSGAEWAFRGEYLEIDPPQRIVQTFEFEGMPGHVATEAMTLTEQDGVTTITVVSTFADRADRDGMIASGMESGAAETYDRLEELLAELIADSQR